MSWWPFGKDKKEFSPAEKTALSAVVAKSEYELIPLKGIQEKGAALPPGCTVTVTASPAKGMDATLELSEFFAKQGYDVVPHFSSRLVRDKAHLADLFARAKAAGIRRGFVVGGDGERTGTFQDGLDLLRAFHEVGHPFNELTVPAYPEGHSALADDVLQRVLKEKQPLANGMRTQMAFDPEAVAAWVRRVRADGITLPLFLGVPGVVEMTKLMRISTQIGIADSARYLSKNPGMLGRLAIPGSFGPDAFLAAMAETIADPASNVTGLHVFSFNSIDTTSDWQRRMLEELK
jgi:methylenetetrahydrofolate reductase (NADPH)